MKAQMSAVPEGEGVVAPEPERPPVQVRVVPRGRVVHTEEAAAKVKQSAIRKADGFKLKITTAAAQIDHLIAARKKKTQGFDKAAEQHKAEIVGFTSLIREGEQRKENIKGQMYLLQLQVSLLQDKGVHIEAVMGANKQDIAATKILLQAAQQKAEEAGAQDQPKIDQLTKTRNKLVERLYHHQLLHPGCISEKAETDV